MFLFVRRLGGAAGRALAHTRRSNPGKGLSIAYLNKREKGRKVSCRQRDCRKRRPGGRYMEDFSPSDGPTSVHMMINWAAPGFVLSQTDVDRQGWGRIRFAGSRTCVWRTEGMRTNRGMRIQAHVNPGHPPPSPLPRVAGRSVLGRPPSRASLPGQESGVGGAWACDGLVLGRPKPGQAVGRRRAGPEIRCHNTPSCRVPAVRGSGSEGEVDAADMSGTWHTS